MDMFPTEEAAVAWFESVIWPNGRHCPKCGSVRTREASHRYCRIGAATAGRISAKLERAGGEDPAAQMGHRHSVPTSLKSVSHEAATGSVFPPTAWFMLRIREAWACRRRTARRNLFRPNAEHVGEQAKVHEQEPRPAVGKTAVVGVKDRGNEVRAEVVQRTDGATLQGFVREHTEAGATSTRTTPQPRCGDHEAQSTVSEYVGVRTPHRPSGPCQRPSATQPASQRGAIAIRRRPNARGLSPRPDRDNGRGLRGVAAASGGMPSPASPSRPPSTFGSASAYTSPHVSFSDAASRWAGKCTRTGRACVNGMENLRRNLFLFRFRLSDHFGYSGRQFFQYGVLIQTRQQRSMAADQIVMATAHNEPAEKGAEPAQDQNSKFDSRDNRRVALNPRIARSHSIPSLTEPSGGVNVS